MMCKRALLNEQSLYRPLIAMGINGEGCVYLTIDI